MKKLMRALQTEANRTADQRGDLIIQFEGRKRVLLLGPHYTIEPLSKDHRDDLLRWVSDLDAAIEFLKGETNGRVHKETHRGLVAVRVHEAQGRQADPHQAQRSEDHKMQEMRVRELEQGIRNYQQAVESLIAIHCIQVGSVSVSPTKHSDASGRSAAPK